MTLFSKIQWVTSILLVFFIVLITNLIDRSNFNRLSDSVTTIYEDRIVASDILFEISSLIHKHEIAAVLNEKAFYEMQQKASINTINKLLDRYSQTKLTEKELILFTNLQEEIKTLNLKEQAEIDFSNTAIQESISKINQQLSGLSKIQVYEGEQQVNISDKAKDTLNLFTQIEIIFLIAMAILMQVIVLYKPKVTLEN